MKFNMIVIVVLVSLVVGCANAQMQQLMDENREMRARLDNDQAEQHQSGYPDMRQNAEAERAAQRAQNAPNGNEPPVAGQPPQMGAHANPAAAPMPQQQQQMMIVPNVRAYASVAGGTMGGPNENRSGNFHLRVFPGAGIGMVVTTESGINVPINGGGTAMLDQNGRRVYVIPGVEEGQGFAQRDVYFPIVRPGSITVSCLQRPALEVMAAGVPPVSQTVGGTRTIQVDGNHPFAWTSAGFCGE